MLTLPKTALKRPFRPTVTLHILCALNNPLVKYEIKRHIVNDEDSSFFFLGYNTEYVSRSEYEEMKTSGWILVRKKYFIITTLIDWYKKQSDTIKIGIPALFLSFIALLAQFSTQTNEELNALDHKKENQEEPRTLKSDAPLYPQMNMDTVCVETDSTYQPYKQTSND